MFEVKRNSLWSDVVLNENYSLCNRCTSTLSSLFDFYLEFVDQAAKPSFLKSTFTYNETLNVFQLALHPEESDNANANSASAPAGTNLTNVKSPNSEPTNVGAGEVNLDKGPSSESVDTSSENSLNDHGYSRSSDSIGELYLH